MRHGPATVIMGVVLFVTTAVWAQTPSEESRQIEAKAAFAAADKVARTGPTVVAIGEQAKLALPEHYIFVPQPEAGRVLRALGGDGGDDTGIILPDAEAPWFATLRFEKSGYVKDEEAKSWDADALLQNLREGVEQGNEDRLARGFGAWEVKGWVEQPAYDAVNRRLVWAALITDKGQQDGSVNYNTYVLGRDGYVSLNLVSPRDLIATYKSDARALLAAIAFEPGKRYSDFNASTDHVAEFGIAALIGGVAAKKLGLLAMAGVFLLKMWKLAALAVVGAVAGLRRIFGGGKNSDKAAS